MKQRIVIFSILLLLAVVSIGCDNGNPSSTEYDDGYSQLRDKYYTVDSSGFIRQAWKVSIEDGRILTACPDPLCTHGEGNPTCPFYKTVPVLIADGGRYLFYDGWNGRTDAIYCFDTETNKTSKIYDYDKVPTSNPQFMYGEGRLYFDLPQIDSSGGDYLETPARTLMYYDITTKEVKEYGKKVDSQILLFEYHGKLYYRDKNGKVFSTTGSFDDSDPLKLPEGGEFNPWSGYWDCGPGYVSKATAPGDIYLYDEGRSIPMPEEVSDQIMRGLTNTNNTFYFTVGFPESTDEDDGYYIIKICILEKSGAYRIYAVQSNYSFYIAKGYGDRVICSILNEYRDGVELIPGTSEGCTHIDLMWIDLQSGKASLYNSGLNPGNVLNVHLADIELKVERLA